MKTILEKIMFPYLAIFILFYCDKNTKHENYPLKFSSAHYSLVIEATLYRPLKFIHLE